MKLLVEQMILFDLDYGDLIRPPFEILEKSGWSQCTNGTSEHLIVYGPKAKAERSIFDTSPYVLPPGAVTPDGWDCKGFLVPSDRTLQRWWTRTCGPLATKFWNHRRFAVWSHDPTTYCRSWDNEVFLPSQINWAIPTFSYGQILSRQRDTSTGSSSGRR
jgi:hypothetical protein